MREFDSLAVAFTILSKEQGINPNEPAGAMFVFGLINGLMEQQEIKVLGIQRDGKFFNAQHPNVLRELLTRYPKTFLEPIHGSFVAGGLLPTVFGKESDEIWQQIVQQTETRGNFTFAGISLERSAMEITGEFFRWLNTELYCVDERLDMKPGYHGIHCQCGACAAVSKSLGLIDTVVEDQLHTKYNRPVLTKRKRPILPGTETAHESLSILVSYEDQPMMIRNDLREILSRHGMLPFHASIPLEKIREFIQKKKGGDEQCLHVLIDTLCLLNIKIPANIIAGHHNTLHAHAHETTVIFPPMRKRGELTGIVEGAVRNFELQSAVRQ